MTRTEITKVNVNQTMITFTGRLLYFDIETAFTASFFPKVLINVFQNQLSFLQVLIWELYFHLQNSLFQTSRTPSVLPYRGLVAEHVNGTTVTRCCGIGMEMPIHPKITLEVLFLPGQFRYNLNIQNVHFQLKVNFALVRFKSFLYSERVFTVPEQ